MSAPPQAIYLYDDPDAAGLDVDHLAHWLAERLPDVPIHARPDFLTFHLGRLDEAERSRRVSELERALQAAEVHNLVQPADRDRLPAEAPADRGWDVVYDGPKLQAALGGLLPADETGPGAVHVALTVRHLGDWASGDPFLRLRAVTSGRPHLVSISSLVEGLALPRQYHFMRQQLAVFGVPEEMDDLAEQFGDQALGHGDARLNEVLKGCVLQAVFDQVAGEGSCAAPGCRLRSAGSHEEALRTQLAGPPGLCRHHAEMLESWGGVPE